MRNTDDFSSIWELYGLKANPFSTNPLLVKGGIIPIDCFYGRKNELERIKKLFRSFGGTRALVTGNPGVGKTTLVNFARANAINAGYFSPFHEIKVQPNWTSDDLILNTIFSIYSTLKITGSKLETNKLSEKLKPFVDFQEIKGKQYSASVMGSGGGYGESVSIHKPQFTSSFLIELFQNTISDLQELGFREVIIHYNNLELFEENENTLKTLLNDSRDFLQTPNVHFLFVGNKNLPSLFQSIPRVSAIFQDTPISLDSLSLDELITIIKKRTEALKISDLKTISPCDNEAIALLYQLHNGNTRAIFNSLSTVILETIKERPITFSSQKLSEVLLKIAKQRFISKISPVMQKVLSALLEIKEGTNKILSEKTDISPQNMSSYLKDLTESGCIYLVRVEGREKFYSVSEWVKWLSLESNPKPGTET